MPDYKLKIMDLVEAGEDGGDSMGWYSKGHQDPFEFSKAVNAYTGIDSYSDIRHCRSERVRQEWWRTVPMTGQNGCVMFKIAKQGTPGAYPVTVFEFGSFWANSWLEKEKEYFKSGEEQGQRIAANFAYRWIGAVKGFKAAEEFLSAWNQDRSRFKP